MKKLIVTLCYLIPICSIASEWKVGSSLNGSAVALSPTVDTQNGDTYMAHNGLIFVDYHSSCESFHNQFKVINFNEQPVKTRLVCLSDQVVMIQPRTEKGNRFIQHELSHKKYVEVSLSTQNQWKISTQGFNKAKEALENGDYTLHQPL